SKVPISGASGVLNDVDCVSPTACIAVGTGKGPNVLAVRWNGKSWSPATTGPPAGALEAVSCTSASNCVAVGQIFTRPAIVRWNAGARTAETAQPPPGNAQAYLYDVSCPAASNCYAVGYSSVDGQHRYMQHWDGTHWSTVNTPAPPRGPNDGDSFT